MIAVKRPITVPGGVEGHVSWSLTFGEFAYLFKRLLPHHRRFELE